MEKKIELVINEETTSFEMETNPVDMMEMLVSIADGIATQDGVRSVVYVLLKTLTELVEFDETCASPDVTEAEKAQLTFLAGAKAMRRVEELFRLAEVIATETDVMH